jgi:RNase P subunit RPR2
MKCPNRGCWSSVPVDKVLVEQPSPEAKVRVMLPMYNPLKATSCKKCGKLLAEPKELIRIVKTKKT